MAVEPSVSGSARVPIVGGTVVGVVPDSRHDVLEALRAIVDGGGQVNLRDGRESLLVQMVLITLLSQDLLNFGNLFACDIGGLRPNTFRLESRAQHGLDKGSSISTFENDWTLQRILGLFI